MTGLLLIDKPQDWTSSDVVAKLRGVLHEKRIGHGGTLDPLATGLLIIMVGNATKASEYVIAHDKSYSAALRPGVVTDTQDITGNVLTSCPAKVTEEELRAAADDFTGEITQIPPMYSAIKYHGKKLYEIARCGGEVERKPRNICINSITITGRADRDFTMDISCSSGTYIRTLCHDIGARLGCGACMSALRRTRVGKFSIDDAHTIDEIIKAQEKGKICEYLIPLERVFSEFPAIEAEKEAERKIICGNPVPEDEKDGLYRVFSRSGAFLMLGRVRNGILYVEKSFWS